MAYSDLKKVFYEKLTGGLKWSINNYKLIDVFRYEYDKVHVSVQGQVFVGVDLVASERWRLSTPNWPWPLADNEVRVERTELHVGVCSEDVPMS